MPNQIDEKTLREMAEVVSQRDSNLGPTTRVPLPWTITIVASAIGFTFAFTVAWIDIKTQLSTKITKDYIQAWSDEYEHLNPGSKTPNPYKIKP